MAQAFFYIQLIIVVYHMRFVFLDCLQSHEQCCAGYVWNKQLNKCERCKSGFSGLSCKLRCPPPSYGLNCQHICKCKHNQTCNFRYGCISNDHGCEDGLFGPLCLESCPYPSYGKDCQRICNCDIEVCDHKEGCVDDRATRDSFNHIFSNVSTTDFHMSPNKSDLDKFKHPKSTPNNKEISSFFSLGRSKITPNIGSALSTGSGEQTEKSDIRTVSPSNNLLIILLISSNSFSIVMVCCICGICVYCKRKLIFNKPFEVNMDGNVYDRKRQHAKRLFFHETLRKSQDFDLEITNMGGNSLQRFTNDNDSDSLEQRGHLDLYEIEPDPYLGPETNVTEPEYHPYLTVV